VQKWLDTDYNAKSRACAFFAGCGLVTSQLAINTIDNAFSSGMDIAGLCPTYINIRRGAYIGLIASIALCPWQLLSSASTFISVLSAYSVFLGPMTGIMICDYWMIRGAKLKLSDLYHGREDGIFYFWFGINWRSFLAWVCGWSFLVPGLVKAITPASKIPYACTQLYYLAFPLGFTVSFIIYYVLNKLSPPPGLGVIDEVDEFGTFTPEEGDKLGVLTSVIQGSAQQGVEDDLPVYDDKMDVMGKH
jgi:NCS1 family nucleobase:cation symporter-1